MSSSAAWQMLPQFGRSKKLLVFNVVKRRWAKIAHATGRYAALRKFLAGWQDALPACLG